ncbi:MAG: hypothetical protein Tsb0020_55930 [Haliangiales bacterium]
MSAATDRPGRRQITLSAHFAGRARRIRAEAGAEGCTLTVEASSLEDALVLAGRLARTDGPLMAAARTLSDEDEAEAAEWILSRPMPNEMEEAAARFVSALARQEDPIR